MLYNFIKISDCFIGLPVCQKIAREMQRISVNLINNCTKNQLNYNYNLPAIGKKNFAIGNKNSVEWRKAADHAVAQGTRFCTPTYFFIYNYLQQLFYRENY